MYLLWKAFKRFLYQGGCSSGLHEGGSTEQLLGCIAGSASTDEGTWKSRGHTEKLRAAWLSLVSQQVGERQRLLQAGRRAGGCCPGVADTGVAGGDTLPAAQCPALPWVRCLSYCLHRENFLSLPGLAHTHFTSKMIAVMTFCPFFKIIIYIIIVVLSAIFI